MSVPAAEIGIIGGSGFSVEGVSDLEPYKFDDTPFGSPSDAYHLGEVDGTTIAFLARHGSGHKIPPSELPNRANIYGFKVLGVSQIVSISAVGSLREEIAPQHLVVPDQLWDRTIRPHKSFFDDGVVAHIPFAEPFCPDLRVNLIEAAKQTDTVVHGQGTYVCMEGPQFSTRFESRLHKSLGADIVGMTASPEAKLAREAEICYAILAMSTDYDAWHEDHEAVDVKMIFNNMLANGERARRTISHLIPLLSSGPGSCDCHNALAGAIVTDLEVIPRRAIEYLGPIVAKYLTAIES